MGTVATTTCSKEPSTSSEVTLESLPAELILSIFQYLGDEDLCRMALCNRWLREVANNDNIWCYLCQRNGWERYGTVNNLEKSVPYGYTSYNMKETDTGEKLDLVATCKWKECYMKEHHLKSNWEKGRFYTTRITLPHEDQDHRIRVIGTQVDGAFVIVAVASFMNGTDYCHGEKVQVWDAMQGSCRHVITVAASRGSEALKVKNGIIVVGCIDGTIRTFSVKTGEALQVMRGHKEKDVSRVFFDGETIVSRAIWTASIDDEDHDIHIWSVTDGVCQHILKGGPDLEGTSRTRLIEVDYRDKIVAAAYMDNCLRIWDTKSGACLHTLKPSEPNFTLVSCALGNAIVVSTVSDGHWGEFVVNIWKTESGECIQTFQIHEGIPANICFYLRASKLSCKIQHSLICLKSYLNMLIAFYTQSGKLVRHFTGVSGLESLYFHGNKVVYAGLPDKDAACQDYIRIYKVINNDLKFISSSSNVLNTQEPLQCSVIFMDETKIGFIINLDSEKQGDLYIHHYW